MQDDSLHRETDRCREHHGRDAVIFGCHVKGAYTAEAIAITAAVLTLVGFVLVRVVSSRAVMMLMMDGRWRLFGRGQVEPSMRVSADKGDREQHSKTPDEDKPHVAASPPDCADQSSLAQSSGPGKVGGPRLPGLFATISAAPCHPGRPEPDRASEARARSDVSGRPPHGVRRA